MILNSRDSNFIFNFPRKFIYESLQKEYKKYFDRLQLSYASVTDALNHSIQSVSFTGVNADTVEQRLDGLTVNWKDGFDVEEIMDKEITVTFKSYAGYLNYWLLYEQLVIFLNGTTEQFLPDLYLSFLDESGYEFIRFKFKQILFLGISDLDLNYTSNVADFSDFTCTFKFNRFEIEKPFD